MGVDIQYDSAQDEVCVEIWEVLQAIKTRTLNYINDNPHNINFSHEVDDMLYLLSRVSDFYRQHAERAPSEYAESKVREANGTEIYPIICDGIIKYIQLLDQ
jgi:hypothetical protein